MNKSSLLALVLLAVAGSACAEAEWPEHLDVDLSYRNSASMVGRGRWDLRLGAGVEREPTYQGSDRSTTETDPFLIAAYRADWGNLFLSGDGLGYSRVFGRRFGLMLRLEQEDTREVDDDARLAGLGSQDEELELEIVGRYFSGPWSLGLSVAPATGDKGVVWFVAGTYTWRALNDRLFLTVGTDLSGSDGKNQRTDFGITPAQSLTSGFPEYTPNGGLKSFGVNINAEYRLGESWFLYADLDFERLLGDVADSPIVFDDRNVEASVGIVFRF